VTGHSLAQKGDEELKFSIEGFLVEGNSLLPEDKIQDALEPLTGKNRGSTDVEKARDALEQLYHKKGYPTVLVNIPEQTVDEGIIRLEVIENRIEKVNITGNRYVSMEKIKKTMPSFSPGEVIYAPEAQKEIGKINENPDITLTPAVIPGKVPGAVDIELKVEDKPPLHGTVEISNRANPHTTDLRLNAAIHFDNLWQRDHSVAVQYQVSPENPDEVQVFSGTYVLPVPWNTDQRLAVYGIKSDGNTAFGEGFQTVGKGSVIGMRYVIPLAPYKEYGHNLILGVDYKDFTEMDPANVNLPVTYFPLSLAYTSVLKDSRGSTQFNAGLNMSLRGFVSDQSEFAAKRSGAQGDYMYGTAGIERTQDLPGGMKLYAKIDGQASSEPLINNEQYSAGGMESVRGYKETDVLGDNAIHGTFELRTMEILERCGIGGGRVKATPFAFFDFANTFLEQALPGQKANQAIQGTGIGMRGLLGKSFEYDTAWGVALSSTDNTRAGDSRMHFRMKYLF
jgi:hemolysin activation/secretion protein